MLRTAALLAVMIAAPAVLLAARPAQATEDGVGVCDHAYCTVTHKH